MQMRGLQRAEFNRFDVTVRTVLMGMVLALQ